MANIFQIVDKVTMEVLEIAHEKSTFIGTVNRQFDSSFDGTSGNTLRIRLPDQIEVRQDSWVMDVQDVTEQAVTLTHGYVIGADLKFTTPEILFALGNEQAFMEISKRKIEPAISKMISTVESRVLQAVTKDVYQLVGTPGTKVGASGDIEALHLARAKINQQAAPHDNRHCQLDSVTMASVSNGIKSLFHEGPQITEAFREGFITRSAMATFWENERTYAHTNGDDVAWAVDDAAALAAYTDATGLSTLNMDAMGTTASVGSVFTIADLYDVHPETKQPYAHLKQFTVTAVGTIAGNQAEITFSPTIRIDGPLQNTYLASGVIADLEDNFVTLVGSASTRYQHNLMYHQDAFTFVMGMPAIMDDSIKCVAKRKENMAFRVWLASDIRSSELLLRVDGVYGWKTLRPDWACRITN